MEEKTISTDLNIFDVHLQNNYYTEAINQICKDADHEILWDIYRSCFKNIPKKKLLSAISFKEMLENVEYVKLITWKDGSIIGFCVITTYANKAANHNNGKSENPSSAIGSSNNNFYYISIICVQTKEINQHSIFSLIKAMLHFSKRKEAVYSLNFPEGDSWLHPENIIDIIKEYINVNTQNKEFHNIPIKEQIDNIKSHSEDSNEKPFNGLLASEIRDMNVQDKLGLHFLSANTPELKEEVYRLRHKAYTQRNEIEINPDGKFYDKYDLLPNSYSFLALYKNNIIGSIRAVVYSKSGDQIPSMENYSDILFYMIKSGRKIVESCRFCILEDYKKYRVAIAFPLFRLVTIVARQHLASDIITTVRSSHKMLYEKMLGFKCLSEEREYPGVNFKTVLLHLDFQDIIEKGEKNKPKLYNFFFNQKADIINI